MMYPVTPGGSEIVARNETTNGAIHINMNDAPARARSRLTGSAITY
jgi:hypothetical protein